MSHRICHRAGRVFAISLLIATLSLSASRLRAEEEQKGTLFHAGLGLSSFDYSVPGSVAPSPILLSEPALSPATIQLFQLQQGLRTFPTGYEGSIRTFRGGAEWPLFLQGRISLTLDISAKTVRTTCSDNCPGTQAAVLLLATDRASREIAATDPTRPYSPNLALIHNTLQVSRNSTWSRTEYALESAFRFHAMPEGDWDPYMDLGAGAGLCPGSENACTLVKIRFSPGVRLRLQTDRFLFIQLDREYVSYRFQSEKRYRELLPETGFLFGMAFRTEGGSESDDGED